MAIESSSGRTSSSLKHSLPTSFPSWLRFPHFLVPIFPIFPIFPERWGCRWRIQKSNASLKPREEEREKEREDGEHGKRRVPLAAVDGAQRPLDRGPLHEDLHRPGRALCRAPGPHAGVLSLRRVLQKRGGARQGEPSDQNHHVYKHPDTSLCLVGLPRATRVFFLFLFADFFLLLFLVLLWQTRCGNWTSPAK